MLGTFASPWNCVYSAALLAIRSDLSQRESHGLRTVRLHRFRGRLRLDVRPSSTAISAKASPISTGLNPTRWKARRSSTPSRRARSTPISAACQPRRRGSPEARPWRRRHDLKRTVAHAFPRHLQQREATLQRRAGTPRAQSRHRSLGRREGSRPDHRDALCRRHLPARRPIRRDRGRDEENAGLRHRYRGRARRSPPAAQGSGAGKPDLRPDGSQRPADRRRFRHVSVDQWRQIGVNAKNVVVETPAMGRPFPKGAFEAIIDIYSALREEPTEQMTKYVSHDVSARSAGRFTDRELDKLWQDQALETDPAKRRPCSGHSRPGSTRSPIRSPWSGSNGGRNECGPEGLDLQPQQLPLPRSVFDLARRIVRRCGRPDRRAARSSCNNGSQLPVLRDRRRPAGRWRDRRRAPVPGRVGTDGMRLGCERKLSSSVRVHPVCCWRNCLPASASTA